MTIRHAADPLPLTPWVTVRLGSVGSFSARPRQADGRRRRRRICPGGPVDACTERDYLSSSHSTGEAARAKHYGTRATFRTSFELHAATTFRHATDSSSGSASAFIVLAQNAQGGLLRRWHTKVLLHMGTIAMLDEDQEVGSARKVWWIHWQ